jgi:NADH dehydrogenase [ubiquinone] 1 alpha subcomplex assembly factor 7
VTLADRLLSLIAQNGPLTVAQYMTSALYDPQDGYYTRNAALGADGDFITAPEASQMFGELVGLWCAQEWRAMGAPAPFNLVELGPGAGTLISDAWRATRIVAGFHDAARISLVEASETLRVRQTQALDAIGAHATWITRLEEAPHAPTLIVANEFLDCMPIRQFVRIDGGWRERLVGARDGKLTFGFAQDALPDNAFIPPALCDATEGAIAEIAPSLPAFVASLAERFSHAPGRALIIDYGAVETTGGDTLQAVRRHTRVDPLDSPGAADLTAHVDFVRLAALARDAGLAAFGPVPQGAWLEALGIRDRAAALTMSRPDKAQSIAAQLHRLTAPGEMGVLFNAVCLTPSDSPPPAGFERTA